MKHMKRFLITLALALAAVSAFAQRDIPAGMRMEFTEVEQDDNEYAIFTYKDEDGTYGYYLSLGRSFELMSILRDDVTDFSFKHIDEICLLLGATADEAAATLESFQTLLDAETGTVTQFPCRRTNGAEGLTVPDTATCTVVKRFLQAKRLCFQFVSGHHTADADLTKPALKSLIWNFGVARKLRPDW